MAEKAIRLGLGEAVQRLFRLEFAIRQGTTRLREQDLREHSMLLEALNHHTLDLGLDCDGDGIPDTVEIFEQSAKTGCCSLLATRVARTSSSTSRSRRRSR